MPEIMGAPRPPRFRIFVYGTLRRGRANHGVIAAARYLGPARTKPAWRRVTFGPYPAIVPGEDVIDGELYEVDEAMLTILDRFEGVPELYVRIEIELDDGTRAQAYVPAPRAEGDGEDAH
jgi:gamma-glutamylcyclotransferase (GGCT)/AIG2-like uncharacterized protein YtfP